MLIAIPLTLLAMPVSRIVFSRSWFCSPNWMSSLTPCCWAASLAPFTTASKKAFDDWSHGMKRILIFDHSALWSASAAPAAATPNSDRAAPIADAAISLVTEFMRFLTICGLGFLGDRPLLPRPARWAGSGGPSTYDRRKRQAQRQRRQARADGENCSTNHEGPPGGCGASGRPSHEPPPGTTARGAPWAGLDAPARLGRHKRAGWPEALAAPEERGDDQEIERVPHDPVQERHAVGAGEVEDDAGDIAAERHAEDGRRDHGADRRARPARRQKLAADDRVHRHDAALKQPEQSGDDEQGHEPVEIKIEQERGALHGRADQERRRAPDRVGDEARADAGDDAEHHHQGQHLSAARDAVAEIAAIGDQMDLWHRHRGAAGKAGENEQDEQEPRGNADIGARGLGRRLGLGKDRRDRK